MLKGKMVYVKNIICYFIPFVVMTVLAVAFLHRTFSLLIEKNTILLEKSMQDVLDDIESEFLVCTEIANEMCIDAALSRGKVLGDSGDTLAAIDQMLWYSHRIEWYPTVFLTYTDERVVSKRGTETREVFAESLNLSEDGFKMYRELMESTERFQSSILEKENGERYLLLLYYYPASKHIEEKRIGYIFEANYFETILHEVMEGSSGTLMLILEDEIIAIAGSGLEGVIEGETEEIYENILERNRTENHTLIICRGGSLNFSMYTLLDNSILKDELTEEAAKMIAMGSVCFILLSAFLWFYGKYRYRLIFELRQLAERSHKGFNESRDVDVIRSVLQNNFDTINRQNEDLLLFQKEAKRQMGWLLLNSTPPDDINLEELLDKYNIINFGNYYCVLAFWIADEVKNTFLEIDNIPEVLVSCVAQVKGQSVYITGIALPTRDSNHQLRMGLIREIKQKLLEKGHLSRYVSAGLIYEQITQLNCSRIEAISLLEIAVNRNSGEGIAFFDESARVANKVPHIISGLLEEFSDCVRQQDCVEADKVLRRLLSVPKEMDEGLLVYVRYKIVQIFLGLLTENELSTEMFGALISFVELEDEEFEKAVKEFIRKHLVKPKRVKKEANEILEYIEEQFNNSELSLNMVAEYFQISARSVNRILKNNVGKTYKEYLDDFRLQKACELLLNTEMDIKNIVNQVGYFDLSSFIRLFKMKFDMTPGEYRYRKGKKGGH